ncbi:RNase adapter RapZ (plasmid) [Streptomyces sp. NBC_01298]|uniref:RapZ C-terminal domain-containing protein n=1 Tax=Streptomyces sp. NBC_01298 TaxID=2903817 RepID=UPI002E10DCD2|nr:RNase adapter RapZ [Streptomyces sp. NBC_01298]WSK25942.1 RNase adapter RapZ [Streptomyces sp. NBC_01298]
MTRNHTENNGLVQVVLQSAGTLHPGTVELIGDGLFFDIGGRLRNPHHDPAMRYRTGLEPEVRSHVLTTPGANRVINEIMDTTRAVLYGYAEPRRRLVKVTVACRGGRHRSVAIAEQVAEYLRAEDDICVEVEHPHVSLPVVENQP